MTPAARINAAIDILDHVLAGYPAEQALLRWSRASRFAGSGDRNAVRDLVFDALRRRNSFAALGGSLTGRGLMIGQCRATGRDPEELFTGEGYAPAPLTDTERKVSEERVEDLPEWLSELLQSSLGDQAATIIETMGERAPVWLRVNRARGNVDAAISALTAEGIETEQAPQLPTALRVLKGERKVSNSRAYQAGLIELQDLSPQLACENLPLRPNDRVLDYCAGGGGKSLALAARHPGLRLFAHDADPARMADLPTRAARAGADITLTNNPQGRFDLVIADVPCSGSGTWRRTPDAKWRLTPETLDHLAKIQAKILRDVIKYVAPGGHIAYMTCSLLNTENKQIIDDFVAFNPAFSEIKSRQWTPRSASDGFYLSLIKHNSN